MHRPHDGSALSHLFFFRRQFTQTLDDLDASTSVVGDESGVSIFRYARAVELSSKARVEETSSGENGRLDTRIDMLVHSFVSRPTAFAKKSEEERATGPVLWENMCRVHLACWLLATWSESWEPPHV